jgi:hypothetical protein
MNLVLEYSAMTMYVLQRTVFTAIAAVHVRLSGKKNNNIKKTGQALRNQLYVACVMGWPMQPARLGIFLLVLLPLCHTGRQSALQIVDHVDCRFLRKALVNVKVIPLRDSSR